jgi:hypothetical protein
VNPAAALVGTQGMQVVVNDTTSLYVTDDRPTSEPRYRARFYFDPNSIAMANADAHYILQGYSGTSTLVLRIEFRYSSGVYQIRAALLNDATTWSNSLWFTLSDAPHYLELDWQAATAVGANNGALAFWVDGVQRSNITGIDNDARRIDRARLGAVAALDAGTSGTYYFDAFESHRQTMIGADASANVAAASATGLDPAELHTWTEEEDVPEEMEPPLDEEPSSEGRLYLPSVQSREETKAEDTQLPQDEEPNTEPQLYLPTVRH